MELFICNADGTELRQLTHLGNANWAPFFHPSGEKILFSSNFEAERGFPFNLYMIDIDGKNLERVTHGETFDAFPVFSNDGKKKFEFQSVGYFKEAKNIGYKVGKELLKKAGPDFTTQGN